MNGIIQYIAVGTDFFFPKHISLESFKLYVTIVHSFYFLFQAYYINYAITVVPVLFSPLSPSVLHPPPYSHPSSIPPPLSSCLWVTYISSLASPFPILFSTSRCLFCTYQLCFLFPVPFPSFSPFPLLINYPPCDLHFCDSVHVLVVCLICFCFLGSDVDSCEFVVIFLFIFLIIFFLDKSL